MSFLRRLAPQHKLYASFALLLCLSMGLSLWMLGRLEQMSLAAAAPGLAAGSLADQAHAGYAGARLLAWIAIGVTLGAAGILVLWLRDELARPVREAAAMAQRVATGDLSGKVGQLETAALLTGMQDMSDSLAGMIAKVRDGTENIAASTSQVAAGSSALSWDAQEQLGTLAKAAASMAQLAGAARQNAGQTHLATTMARSASALAADGSAAADRVAASLTTMNAAAIRITGLAGVIDALALQANMLALNAGVEAARAGPHGRGFAAVAAEVRALAQQSASAAKDIKMLSEDCAARGSDATRLATESGRTMDGAAGAIAQLSIVIGNLQVAGAAQVGDVEHASKLIAAVKQANERTCALAKQTGAAAASMREQAAKLSRASAAFVLGPEHGAVLPAIRLVSNNPAPLSKPPAARDMRQRHLPARAVVSLASAPATQRNRSAFGRRAKDWEDF